MFTACSDDVVNQEADYINGLVEDSYQEINDTDDDNVYYTTENNQEIEGYEYIQWIRSSFLQMEPLISIDEAFGLYFDTQDWDFFVANTGESIVEFSGESMYTGDLIRTCLQFIVDKENDYFRAVNIAIHGEPQPSFLVTTFLNKVFRNARNIIGDSVYDR